MVKFIVGIILFIAFLKYRKKKHPNWMKVSVLAYLLIAFTGNMDIDRIKRYDYIHIFDMSMYMFALVLYVLCFLIKKEPS